MHKSTQFLILDGLFPYLDFYPELVKASSGTLEKFDEMILPQGKQVELLGVRPEISETLKRSPNIVKEVINKSFMARVSGWGFAELSSQPVPARPLDALFLQIDQMRGSLTWPKRTSILELLNAFEQFQSFSADFKEALASHLSFGLKSHLTAREITEAHFAIGGLSLDEFEAGLGSKPTPEQD